MKKIISTLKTLNYNIKQVIWNIYKLLHCSNLYVVLQPLCKINAVRTRGINPSYKSFSTKKQGTNSVGFSALWVPYFGFIFIILCVLNFAVIPVSAEEYEKVECVILLDVSGSMGAMEGTNEYVPAKGSDPMADGTRISLEAIKAFTFECPHYVSVELSLIVFNDKFVTVTKSPVNISTKEGKASLNKDLDNIFNNKISGDINCWSGNTDIEQPLEEAKKILSKTTDKNIKKGVLLFTDGELYFIDKEGRRDQMKIDKSKKKCEDKVTEFKEKDINLFIIGLISEEQNDESSDDPDKLVEFLNRLGKKAGRDPRIVYKNKGDKLDRIHEYFLDFYSALIGGTTIEPPIEIKIDGTMQERPFNIYGEITREVNIFVSTDKKLDEIKIYHRGDGGKNSEMTYDKNVTIEKSVKVANVKVKDPPDGELVVAFQGTKNDIAKITPIYLHKVALECLKNDTGNTFDVYLKNEFENKRVELQRIYEDADCSFMLIDKQGKEQKVEGKINKNGDGYTVDISNAGEGEYSLESLMNLKDYFSYSNTFTGIMVEPETIGAPSTENTVTESAVAAEDTVESTSTPGTCIVGSGSRLAVLILGIIVMLILAFLIFSFKEVKHKIIFMDGIDKRKCTITRKDPFWITTDEYAKHDNDRMYVVDCRGKSSFENRGDLAKIEAVYSFLPLPRFYKKIRIIDEKCNEDEIKMDPIENPISPPDNIYLNFTSSEGEFLEVKFTYNE